MLLLHGLSSNSRIWDWTAPLLTDRFHVIALDQRGHGLADVPEGGYGFDDATADVAEFVELMGLDRTIVVGHSWGASVALALGVDDPARVRGVVMVDGGLIDLSDHTSWEEAEVMLRPPEIAGIPMEQFVEGMKRWPNVSEMWSDELGEMILSNMDVRDGKVYRRLAVPLHMQIARAIYDLHPMSLLPRLSMASMAIVCVTEPQDDRARAWHQLRLEAVERAENAAPNVKVVVMEDTIHDVPVQKPRELAALVGDFAASLD
jgi:pimeloyl-ACP methyl ester carboxylesterase